MKDSGFTLIELLVVVSIIGILASLGISSYSVYRTQAHNTAARSDLRNARNGQEASFLDRDAYWDCMNAGCEPALPGFKLSPGVSIVCAPRDAGQNYTCRTSHERGDRSFFYDSETNAQWES